MGIEDCRNARQVAEWKPQGKRWHGRPTNGRMELGTACKEETSRMKKVLIESSEGRKSCLWDDENCVFTEIFL
jgi:hypothetical protein